MKKTLFCVYIAFFLLAGPLAVYGIGEKTISIGAGSGWEAVEDRSGLAEISGVRPRPVLALAAAGHNDSGPVPAHTAAFYPAVDLWLSFDEAGPGRFADSAGRWRIEAAGVGAAEASLARTGNGAGRFFHANLSGRNAAQNSAGLNGAVLARPLASSLFSSGKRLGDFSIEFWLFPLNLENGEQIVSWSSSKPDGRGAYLAQKVQCTVWKNRLLWEFAGFFADPAGREAPGISFSGSAVLPGEWSHHLIRFDSGSGLLEYLVNGRLEAVDYASATGGEGGEVYTPLIGEDGSLVLGRRFSGLMDEFRVSGRYAEDPVLAKFPREGRAQTRTIDLGSSLSRVYKLEASGGRTNGAAHNPDNFFAGNRNLKFADHSEIRFFVRVNNTPYNWSGVPWIEVNPGAELSGISGRYIQAAADFYPSGNGELSPYLDELRIVYGGAGPPRPPSGISALAVDGGVELSWRPSPSAETRGYLVYFGTSGGEYFGDYAIVDANEVASPVNAGNRTAVRIEGLASGRLYYFAVASYDAAGEAGEFSGEAAARPLGRRPGMPLERSSVEQSSIESSSVEFSSAEQGSGFGRVQIR